MERLLNYYSTLPFYSLCQQCRHLWIIQHLHQLLCIHSIRQFYLIFLPWLADIWVLVFFFIKHLLWHICILFSVLVRYVTLYLHHHIYLRMDCFFRYYLNIFTQFRLVDYVVPSHWSHKVFGYTILFPNRLKKLGNLIRKIYLLRNPLFVSLWYSENKTVDPLFGNYYIDSVVY